MAKGGKQSRGPEYTEEAFQATNHAVELASKNGHYEATPVHLAMALLPMSKEDPAGAGDDTSDDEDGKKPKKESTFFQRVIALMDPRDILLAPAQFKDMLISHLKSIPKVGVLEGGARPSMDLVTVYEKAEKILHSQRCDTFLAVPHMVEALCLDRNIAAMLRVAGCDPDRVDDPQAAVKKLLGPIKMDSADADAKVGKSDGAEHSEFFEKFTEDLTALAAAGKLKESIGRLSETRKMIEILASRDSNNAVLVGPPGVGKTNLVTGFALRIVSKDVPNTMHNARVLSLEVGTLMAGTKFQGELEERIKKLIAAMKSTTNTFLFIDEMHQLMSAGGKGASNVANLLKTALSKGEFHCIGATTLDEYRQHIMSDAAMVRRFTVVTIDEPSVAEAIDILRGSKESYEKFHSLTISDDAVVECVNLAHRYFTQLRLPASALSVMDGAMAQIRTARDSEPEVIKVLKEKLRSCKLEMKANKEDKSDKGRQKHAKAQEKSNNITSELNTLQAQYKVEKKNLVDLHEAQTKLDAAKSESAKAKRDGDRFTAQELEDTKVYPARMAVTRLTTEFDNRIQMARKADPEYQPMLPTGVTVEEVARVVSDRTGVKVGGMKKGENKRLLEMEKELGGMVIGQEQAIRAASAVIRVQRAGIADPKRPPSFMFCGSTGTGKTELVKALAQCLFGDRNAITRFDMSEYQEKHSVSRLVGAPPGYVGHDNGGQLTNALRDKPYSIILFDEIEKAHPDISVILLQLLDDGRITDSKQNVIDGKNCIVVLTSNLGAHGLTPANINPTTGEPLEGARIAVRDALKGHFRPELLGRISNIIIFNSLVQRHMSFIVKLRVDELKKRLRNSTRPFDVAFSDEVLSFLAKTGYSPGQGARPLERVIDKHVAFPLSVLSLNGSIKERDVVQTEMITERGKPRIHFKTEHTPDPELQDKQGPDDFFDQDVLRMD